MLLSPDLIRYILDPERECQDIKPNPKATLEMRFSKFNISDFEKVKNERNNLKNFFKKFVPSLAYFD